MGIKECLMFCLSIQRKVMDASSCFMSPGQVFSHGADDDDDVECILRWKSGNTLVYFTTAYWITNFLLSVCNERQRQYRLWLILNYEKLILLQVVTNYLSHGLTSETQLSTYLLPKRGVEVRVYVRVDRLLRHPAGHTILTVTGSHYLGEVKDV